MYGISISVVSPLSFLQLGVHVYVRLSGHCVSIALLGCSIWCADAVAKVLWYSHGVRWLAVNLVIHGGKGASSGVGSANLHRNP